MLVVTFDEAEAEGSNGDSSACCGERPGPNSPDPGGPMPGPGGGRVGAVIVSPFVQPGSVNATPYNHYSLLRTIEDLFGLGHLGFAGQAGLRPFGADVFARAAAPGPVGGGGRSCADAAFARFAARPRGRGLALSAAARGTAPVSVSVRLAARGRRVLRARTVRRFRPGHAPAVWRPRHLADGLYLVRFAVPVPRRRREHPSRRRRAPRRALPHPPGGRARAALRADPAAARAAARRSAAAAARRCA